MSDGLLKLASIERQFLKDEIRWLKAGGKVLSPSGEDITERKVQELVGRIEHHDKELNENA